MRALLVLAILGGASLGAEETPRSAADAALAAWLEREVAAIESRSQRILENVRDPESWRATRLELRRELRGMLGLEPEPPRGDLRVTVTGTLERPDLGIAIEKLHFQSLPGLYVTANLYRPLRVEGKLPAILYLCGHGNVVLDGVSYGSKAFYQHHPTWFARSGYVCLILDTLMLGEIEGFHHGTYKLDRWWWPARGYTPAGVEAWNSIRALDLLESRSEVDAARIGVTGRSGGGIGTWWLAALDDRPAALVPVAGITDLRNHVLDGCIEGHCDCNFTINLPRFDYSLVAALAAPRPLLFSNTDKDRIFPLDGVQRIHAALRRLYRALGAEDRLGLCIIEGPHKDTQELQVPAFQWLDRWLRGRADRAPIALVAEKLFDPKELRVFQELTSDALNPRIEERFVPQAAPPPLPASREAFEALRDATRESLRARSLRNLAADAASVRFELRREVLVTGLRLVIGELRGEGPVALPLWLLEPAEDEAKPKTLRLRVLDDGGWDEAQRRLAGVFGTLGVDPSSAPERAARANALAAELRQRQEAWALLAPTGLGPTCWSGDAAKRNQIRRRFLVLGRSLAELQLADILEASAWLLGPGRARWSPSSPELLLEARGDLAALASCAGLLEPRLARFELHDPPLSFSAAGVELLEALRVTDLPQIYAFLQPRPVKLLGVQPGALPWTEAAGALFSP